MATQLFLNDGVWTFTAGGQEAYRWNSGRNSDVDLLGNLQAWVHYVLTTSRGSTNSFLSMATVNGPTAGIEYGDAQWVSPPIDQDITISGAITLNLWAQENNMNANVAINAVVFRVDAQGNLTQIAKSARVTEVGTAPGVNNFTVTPTSTAFKKGDRILVRIFADDAGTMATGFNSDFFYRGPTAAATGDSYISFTETFSFLTTTPTGSVLFLTDTAGPAVGADIEKEMWTSRGSGATTATKASVNGWTNPLRFQSSGTDTEWYSKPLQAFTLAGTIEVFLRASRTGTTNSKLRAEIAVCDSDGSNAVIWGATTDGMPIQSSETEQRFHVVGANLAVTNGQRLRLRVYTDDGATAGDTAMTAGATDTLHYNSNASGAGDSGIILGQTVSEFILSTPKSGSDSAVGTDSASVILPPDLATWYDFSDASTVFEDTALSDLAEADDPIASVDDKRRLLFIPNSGMESNPGGASSDWYSTYTGSSDPGPVVSRAVDGTAIHGASVGVLSQTNAVSGQRPGAGIGHPSGLILAPKPGVTYVFSAYFKASRANQTVGVYGNFQDASNAFTGFLDQPLVTLQPSDGWVRIVNVYTIPTGTTKAALGVRGDSQAATGELFRFDAFQVEEYQPGRSPGSYRGLNPPAPLSQATLGLRPLRKTAVITGKDAALFDGVDDFLTTTALSESQPLTFFVVLQKSTGGGHRTVVDGNDGSNNTTFWRSSAGSVWSMFAGTTISDGVSDTNTHVFLAVFNGANSALYRDGGSAPVVAGNIGTTGWLTGLRLGADRTGAAPFDGYQGEALVFDRVLTVDETNQVGQYLAAKWGLTWTDVATLKAASDSATGADTSTVSIPVSTSDSATGADTSSLATSISASDSATGADTSSAMAKPGTDSATGADTSALTTAISATDSATGADTSAVVTGTAINTSDSGTGADASSLAAAISTTSESATGTETISLNKGVSDSATGADASSGLTAAIPTTDAATGADTSLVALPVTTTESGTGADTSSLTVAITSAGDSGSGTESPSTLTAALPTTDAASGADTSVLTTGTLINASDSATGADTSSAPVVSIPTTDAAAGADTSSPPVVVLTTTEPATAADTSSLAAVLTASDAATGADTSFLAQTKSANDTALGDDTSALAALLPVTDAAAGADTSFLAQTKQGTTETATGVDTSSLTASLAGTAEAGVGVDTVGDRVLTTSDSATGADASALQTGNSKSANETGTTGDVSSLTATVAGTESATGADTSSLSIVDSRQVTDAATGADTAATSAVLAANDAATGSEVSSLSTITPKQGTDAAVGSDTATVTVSLSASDIATAVEVAFIGAVLIYVFETAFGEDTSSVLYGTPPVGEVRIYFNASYKTELDFTASETDEDGLPASEKHTVILT